MPIHQPATDESNLIYANDLWAIKCLNDGNYPSHSPTTIRYNTISGNAYGGIFVTENSNPILEANILAFNNTWSGYSHGTNFEVVDSLASQPVVSYNDFYAASRSRTSAVRRFPAGYAHEYHR